MRHPDGHAPDSLRELQTQPIPRLLLRFALPALAGMLAQGLYNVVDRIYVGNLVGPSALAALSVCFPLTLGMLAFGMTLGVGAASRISLALGEGRGEAARETFRQTLLLAGGGSLGITLLTALGLDPLLRLCGAGRELLPLARTYLEILLWGVPFWILASCLNYVIRACGAPRYAMSVLLLGAGCNVVLDGVLMLGFSLGVRGAAWATAVSQVLSALWGLRFFLRDRGGLGFPRLAGGLRRQEVGAILRVGTSQGVVELSFMVFSVIFNRALRVHGGDEAIAALGVVLGWAAFLYMPAMSLSEAAMPLVGYNYGAGRPDRVRTTLKYALGMSCAFFTLVTLGVALFMDPMIRLFVWDAPRTNPRFLELTRQCMVSFNVTLIFTGTAIVTTGFLQALGRGGLSLLFTLVRELLVPVPLILLLPRLYGLTGIWITYPALDLLVFALACALLLREDRRLARREPVWEGVAPEAASGAKRPRSGSPLPQGRSCR